MENTRGSWWLDLALVGLAALASVVVVAVGVENTGLRVLFGVPLVLFLPGYALVSALYPATREDCDPPFTRETGEGIDKTMRSRIRGLTGIDLFAVSVATSSALAPGVALAHYILGGSIEAVALVSGLGLLTWSFVLIALARRLRLPPDRRFTVSTSWPGTLYDRYFRSDRTHMGQPKPYEATTPLDVALNVVILCTLLIALTSAAYAFAHPPAEQGHDELAVLTQDETGAYVADGYPDDLSDSEPLYVSVTNNHDTTQEYVLYASLEIIDEDGTVIERDDQARAVIELDPGERTYVRHEPEDTLDGDDLRLHYTLDVLGETNRDDPDGPHRSVHIWINDTAGATATPTDEPDTTETPTPTDEPDTTETPTPTDEPDTTETPTPTPEDDDDDGFIIGT